ncbi:MAG TPA: hypothetical protein VFT64_11095 [Rickettsiales bacterium]|nr:hypothetical protein [Rickettsiales bacterium]
MIPLTGSVPSENGVSQSSSFDPDTEEALIRRYSRPKQPEIVFEFTRDPGLLHQYYRIREDGFGSVLGLTRYSGAECEYDRNGYILVAKMGNFCIGGARLNIKTPRRPHLLPMEIEDFRLEKLFPYLQHKQLSYGQVSGVAILPEFRNGEISREILRRAIQKSVALNVHMLFAICPLINSRLYRQEFVGMGWKDTKVHMDVPLPVYPTMEEIKLYLMSSVIDKSVVRGTEYTSSASMHNKPCVMNAAIADKMVFNNSIVRMSYDSAVL